MKFIKKVSPKGLRLPVTAARLIGMEPNDKAEYHVMDGAIVVLKGRMTAMELLRAAQSLQDLSVELHTHLARVCGPCDGCGDIEGCADFCPLKHLDEADITLPEELRREAGIPAGAKLCACADGEGGTVTVTAAGYDYDLRDVPEQTVEMFAAANVCLGELEERLIVGDIVYGR